MHAGLAADETHRGGVLATQLLLEVGHEAGERFNRKNVGPSFSLNMA